MRTGKATVIQGDALDVARSLPSRSIDLIATDPPYYRVKAVAWDRQWRTEREYLDWISALCEEWKRILKPNGSLYLFAGPRMARKVANVVAEHFVVLTEITWVKTAGKHLGCRKESLRSYFPQTERIIFAEQYGSDTAYSAVIRRIRQQIGEPIRSYLDGERERAGLSLEECNAALGTRMAGHYFGRSQWSMPTREAYELLRVAFRIRAGDGTLLARPYDELEEQLHRLQEAMTAEREAALLLRRPFSVTAEVPYTDVWTFPVVQHYPGKHPCEKPLPMIEHIVRASSRPGDMVADFFAGSGPTGEAAVASGRDAVLVEKDPEWARAARERCERGRSRAVA